MFLAGMLFCTACDDENYPLYDVDQQDAVFMEYKNQSGEIVDTLDYEFGFDIASSHQVVVPVRIMGLPRDRERTFKVVPVAENTDMVENVHYTIESTVIAANAVKGEIVINLLRGNDTAIQERQLVLNLRLEECADFHPVGRSDFRVRYSDIHPGKPDWWPASYIMPAYTYEIAQKFFEYFYKTEEVQSATFQKMITDYGDYFVKARSLKGPFAMYQSFLAKFVLIPLREYYRINDPEIYARFPEPSLY